MLASVSAATLKLLFFRAGPEDFPYDPGRSLLLGCIAFAVLSNAALLSFLLPPAAALAGAAVNTAFLALFTRFSLATRKLDNRFQQTFNALLATTAVLTLFMLPFFAKIAPVLAQIAEMVQKDPSLANKPEMLPTPPSSAMSALMLLGIWQIVVICRIFMLAAGVWTMLVFVGILFLMVGLQLGAA
ncbi:hypothetical protein C3942_03320 [Solimonas fluminis]|uniref:Yip1 domain-containing protein n=1 Tax=Solimonas fluminis TaxID=2086571 RepID=A0A2S5TLQ4_9GAMM|nr:hypothetical protein [Solimonas fluminis]PPE75924.1 hypothetical protein C3942_03320 [Solimonas fluminis]